MVQLKPGSLREHDAWDRCEGCTLRRCAGDGQHQMRNRNRSCHARARTSQRAPNGRPSSPVVRSARARAIQGAPQSSLQPAAHMAGRSYRAQVLETRQQPSRAPSWVATHSARCSDQALLNANTLYKSTPSASTTGSRMLIHAQHCTGFNQRIFCSQRQDAANGHGWMQTRPSSSSKALRPQAGMRVDSGLCCNASGLTEGASGIKARPVGLWETWRAHRFNLRPKLCGLHGGKVGLTPAIRKRTCASVYLPKVRHEHTDTWLCS